MRCLPRQLRIRYNSTRHFQATLDNLKYVRNNHSGAFFNNYLLHCRVASQCTSKAGLDVTTQSDCPPPLPLPGPRTTPLPATGDCHAPPTYLPSTLSTPEQPYTGPSPPKKPNLSQVLKSVTPPPPLPGLLPQSEVGLVNHFYYF